MNCISFGATESTREIECTVRLTSRELTIINKALFYYCKQEGKELLLAQQLHRDAYGINSFIRAGNLVTDDEALTFMDNEIKRLQK